MEKIPLFSLFFHSFPEAVLLGAAGLVIIGVRPRFHKAVVFGAVSAAASYVIRQLPLPVGAHTLLLIPISIAVLTFLYKLPLKKAAYAVILALIILIIAEAAFATLVLSGTPLTLEIIMAPENAFLRVLVAIPQMLTLFLVFTVGYHLRGFAKMPPQTNVTRRNQ